MSEISDGAGSTATLRNVFCGWAARHARALALILVAVATVRIIATWGVFSPVTDECAHIACGLEWIERHAYSLEDQHPPLARVAVALGPYLAGAHYPAAGGLSERGAAILAQGPGVMRNLELARAGNLPFFWLACSVVFLWARRCLGAVGGVAALLLFTTLPPILGHAGLATTDMALTATLGAAALATLSWVREPSVRNSLLLGCCGALAVLAKFSSLPFFAASALLMAAWQLAGDWRSALTLTRRHITGLACALALGALLVWAGYFFSFGPMSNTSHLRPAPEFFSGIHSARAHNRAGHLAYLLGDFSQTGFRAYYPVALAVKTPLPFLALLALGAVVCISSLRTRSEWGQPLAFSAGVLGCAVAFSRVNIGVRHVLPVYIGFSIAAAAGLLWLARRRSAFWIGVAAVFWLVLSGAAAHPDYLAYFNLAAGAKPERVLIDSDLDWGQDMKRLAVRLQQLNAPSFGYLAAVFPSLAGAGFPPMTGMNIEQASSGWYAAHITQLTIREHELRQRDPAARFWVDDLAPLEKVGQGIYLWRVSPQQAAEWNAAHPAAGDR